MEQNGTGICLVMKGSQIKVFKARMAGIKSRP